jgi:hypothetical protein
MATWQAVDEPSELTTLQIFLCPPFPQRATGGNWQISPSTNPLSAWMPDLKAKVKFFKD